MSVRVVIGQTNRYTLSYSSAASNVYKGQMHDVVDCFVGLKAYGALIVFPFFPPLHVPAGSTPT